MQISCRFLAHFVDIGELSKNDNGVDPLIFVFTEIYGFKVNKVPLDFWPIYWIKIWFVTFL